MSLKDHFKIQKLKFTEVTPQSDKKRKALSDNASEPKRRRLLDEDLDDDDLDFSQETQTLPPSPPLDDTTPMSTPLPRQRFGGKPVVVVPSSPKHEAFAPIRRSTSCDLKASSIHSKLYRDPIHCDVEIHALCVEIMDTRQFQRLKGLKQLAMCHHVFGGAVHTRFQHSVGVMHLAGKVCRHLRSHQPHLGITDKDILCVEVAGLCHDLGHGPFSHVFDGVFIPLVTEGKSKWKHEKASCDMLDYLIADNNINIKKYDLIDQDLEFIKEMILGVPDEDRIGRSKDKEYLYDVINNTKSGLDVDKMDYYERDSFMAGSGQAGCDYQRLIACARVARTSKDGDFHIAFPEKVVHNVVNFFRTRRQLHELVYTHRVVKAIEYMVVDALVAAEPYFKIRGKGGKMVRLRDCVGDMEAYSWLKDSILDEIERSGDPNLKPAQDIIQRINVRDLYQSVGSVNMKAHDCDADECPFYCGKSIDEMTRSILCMQARSLSPSQRLTEDDIIVNVQKIHWGMKKENPLDYVRFYEKHDVNLVKVNRINVSQKMSHLLPSEFQTTKIRLYVRHRADKETAFDLFQRWCDRNECSSPFPSSQV